MRLYGRWFILMRIIVGSETLRLLAFITTVLMMLEIVICALTQHDHFLLGERFQSRVLYWLKYCTEEKRYTQMHVNIGVHLSFVPDLFSNSMRLYFGLNSNTVTTAIKVANALKIINGIVWSCALASLPCCKRRMH